MGIITPNNQEVSQLEGVHLYHAGMSNCSMRVRMTLHEKGIKWTSHHLDLLHEENITSEYFAIHPKGLVPTLVHDGTVIIESTDIIHYLDETFPNPPLKPNDNKERAEVFQWLERAANNHMCVKTYMFGNLVGVKYRKGKPSLARYQKLQKNQELLAFHEKNSSQKGLPRESLSAAEKVMHACFQELDNVLGRQKWITGEMFSLADIAWVPLYVTLNSAGFPFNDYQNVNRWKKMIQKRPSYSKAILQWLPKGLMADN